jgi:hypothetical protein
MKGGGELGEARSELQRHRALRRLARYLGEVLALLPEEHFG